MSSAIEEREYSGIQRLSEFALFRGHLDIHLAALSGSEFVIIPVGHFPNIYKYNVAKDRWTPVMSLEKVKNSYTVPEAAFDPDSTTLYLTVLHINADGNTCERDLQSIDTEKWTIRKHLALPKRRMEEIRLERIILIGEEIHHLHAGDDHICHHVVLNKQSGNMIQEPAQVHPITGVQHASFSAARNSIVLVGYSKMGGHVFAEYSRTTKRWKVWEWTHAFLKTHSGIRHGFVATMNGRYILSFGGYENGDLSDSIMIYDVDRKQCVVSELRLSKKCEQCWAVLMADQNRGDLLTFGFVKRCYKTEGFRNMVVLPTALILLIGKCFAMEFVHLILGIPNQVAHYRINVGEILKQGWIWRSQSECLKGALPTVWPPNNK